MQEVVYTGPSPSVTGEGIEFPRDTAVPVDDALAESLLRQSAFMTAAGHQAAMKNSTSATVTAPVAVEGVTA